MEQLPLVGYMPAPSGAATPDRTHTSVMPLSTSAKRTLLTRRILPQPLAQTNRFRRSPSVGGLRLRLVRFNRAPLVAARHLIHLDYTLRSNVLALGLPFKMELSCSLIK